MDNYLTTSNQPDHLTANRKPAIAHARDYQHPSSSSDRPSHRSIPQVPVNSKLPIPSFYENANGQWILSDNWVLYGLSGSSQRHRARSLEEPPYQPPSPLPSSPLQLHHASAVNGLPVLQYELAPSNSSNSNSQKLYLPTGWNHTSRRGPLYATSVIVVASLLIAIAVLSTVVGLVARRRARRRRRSKLTKSPTSPEPSKHPCPRDIERGSTPRPSRLNPHLGRKIKQLTIIKINYLSKGRKQAKISRIPVTTRPEDPPPPSVILVDQVRRSASFSSQCRFRPAGNPHSYRCRTHQRILPSHAQADHITPEPLSNQPSDNPVFRSPAPTENHITSSVPLSTNPSSDALNSVAVRPQTTSLYDPDAPRAGTHDEPHLSSPSNASIAALNINSSPQSNRSTSNRLNRLNRTPSRHGLLSSSNDTLSTNTRYRQEPSRAWPGPSYRSYHESIRSRNRTISGSQTPHYPVASSSSTSLPSILPELDNLSLNHHIYSNDISLQSLPQLSSRSSRSGDPTIILGRREASHMDDHQAEGTTFESIGIENRRQSDSLPPAYSSQTAPAESSRAAEKRRMVVFPPEGEDEDLPPTSATLPVEPQQEDENGRQDYYGMPLVAHVATDDKAVLKTLFKMGSAPAINGNGLIRKNETRIGNDQEIMNDHEQLERITMSERRMNEGSQEEQQSRGTSLIPSAPPLLYEGGDEAAEFALDRRRFSQMNTTQDLTINSKQREIDGQQNARLFRPLNDDQIGKSYGDLNMLPLPSDQFIITFDPENFEDRNTTNVNATNDIFGPSAPNHHHQRSSSVYLEDSEKKQVEHLYTHRLPIIDSGNENSILDIGNLPSDPTTPHPSSLIQEHGQADDQEQILNYFSSFPRITDVITNTTTPINHDIILPSAPPLRVENMTDGHDQTSIPFQHFVPPYAE